MENRTADQWDDCFEGSFYDPHCFNAEKNAEEIEDKDTVRLNLKLYLNSIYLVK